MRRATTYFYEQEFLHYKNRNSPLGLFTYLKTKIPAAFEKEIVV